MNKEKNDPHKPSLGLLFVYVFTYVILPFLLMLGFLIVWFKPKWISKNNNMIGIITAILVFCYIIIMKLTGLLLQYVSQFEKVITVKTKSNFASNVGSKKNSMQNIIMDTQGKVYSFSDSLIFWSFKTTNNYIKIKEGETYKIKGFGIRFPFFSMYPVIYSVEDQ